MGTAEVNFVTNLPLTQTSGGWGGISANIYDQLSRRTAANFVGPIDPPYPTIPKMMSKLRRSCGLKGTFSLFDQIRLDTIALAYQEQRLGEVEFDLFHGATPWIHTTPSVPFGAYIDATFTMYLDIYSDPECFSDNDIRRIVEAEGTWLRRADMLFFGSNWVRQQAMREYGLSSERCCVIWTGGNVPLPECDRFAGGHRFLFISLNFEKKGGPIAIGALQAVRKHVPDAELIVIGQRPPPEFEAIDGVTYAGFLKKTEPSELLLFCDYLATARGLVHPTSMDTMGAVLIEAGYYGCPSIASNQFGIPELVLNYDTGFLLDLPITDSQVAEYMLRLCQDDLAYREMRAATRAHTTEKLTWEALGSSMHSAISQATVCP